MASSVFIVPATGTVNQGGTFLADDGSASAPSYGFASDTSTGVIRSGSGQIDFTLAGTQHMRFAIDGVTVKSGDAFQWASGNIGTTVDTILVRDGAANILALKNAANAQTVRIYGTTTGPKYLAASHDGTNGVIDTAASSGLLSLAPTNATSIALGKAITSLAGVTTTGALGIPGIVASANITAQSTNATITSFANPATDADYYVSAQMSVTASTALTTTITCTYTDVSNTARTMIMPSQPLSGSFTAAGAISGAGASIWETPIMHIRAKASTTITLLTSAGTFTGVTYSASGVIAKLN